MTTRLMVLGVIHQQKQAHGYQILHELTSWRAETWTKIRPGSIYHALTQLTKENMLVDLGSEKGQKGSAKTIYTLTSQGKKELLRLIEEALTSYDQEVFTAGLAFISLLTREQAIELAQKRLENHKETVAFLENLPRNDAPVTPNEHPAIIASWSALFSAATEWQKHFLADLNSGLYTFIDD